MIGRDRTPEISADLIGGPGLLPTTDDAREAVKGRVRFERDDLHAWLNSRVVGTPGGDVYSVPDGVMRAYDALVATQEGGRALCPKESAS